MPTDNRKSLYEEIETFSPDAPQVDIKTSTVNKESMDSAMFPFHAFTWDNPSSDSTPTLSLSDGWTLDVGAGAITSTNLADNAVTNAKVDDNAIDTAEIANGAVDTLQIATDAVTNAKVANNAVDVAEIVNSAITEAKINTGAVTVNKIGTGAVIEAKLGTGAVTETKVGSLAISEGKLASAAVTETKLGNGSVVEAKVEALAITEGKLAAGAVTATKIGTGAVETAKIDSLAITAGKVALKSLDVTHLNAGEMPLITDEGLIAYWPLSGDGSDQSEIGGHDAVVSSSPTYELGVSGLAAHFDGTDDKFTVAHHSDFDFGAGDFAISIWFYNDNTPATPEALYSKYDGSTGILIHVDSSNLINALTRNAGAITSQSAAVATATWHHVVFTRLSSVQYLYVNGLLADSDASTKDVDVSSDINIGLDNSTLWWDGLLTEIRIYNYGLTLKEAQYLFINPGGPSKISIPVKIDDTNLIAHWPLDEIEGTAVADVAGTHNGVLTAGSGSWRANGKANGAYHFDGVADVITIPHHADFDVGAGDFTISIWFYNDDTPGVLDALYSKYTGTEGILIYIDTSNILYALTKNAGAVTSITQALSTATWHYMVFLRKSSIQYLYIDGILEDSDASTKDIDVSSDINIGLDNSNLWWDGILDEVRVYNRALTPGEIKFLYNNPGGSPKNLITRRSIAESEITSRHLRFGGSFDLADNTEEWNENNGDLFVLDYTCVSDKNARVPEEKKIVMVPGKVIDSENNEYDNQLARTWSGLNSVYVDTIGVFKTTTNAVLDSEDMSTSNWVDDGTIATTLVDEYFKNHRFTKLVSTSNGASRKQTVVPPGSDGIKSFHAIVKKDTAETDTIVGLYDDTGTAWKVLIIINWSTSSASATNGTLVETHWYNSNTIVEITAFSASITVANTHTCRGHPSQNSQGTAYFTAFMLEDSIYPTFYAPTVRPRGGLYYSNYTWGAAGKISFWMKNFFSYDVATYNKWIISDYDSNGAVVNNIGFYYDESADNFKFYVRGASGNDTLTAGYSGGAWASGNTFANNADLWTNPTDANGWLYVELLWDTVNNTMSLRINGVEIDSGTPTFGTFTPNKNLSIGSIPLITDPTGYPMDSLIADLAIWDTDDTTNTHYATAKPYKGQYSISNRGSGLMISRKSIRINKGEISLIDKVGRSIDVGSQGIRALDKSGEVTHDIADAPSLIGHQYLGHFHWFNDEGTDYRLVAGAPVVNTWTDAAACLVLGNTNAQAAILQVHMRTSKYTTQAVDVITFLRPKGTTWAAAYASNPVPYLRNQMDINDSNQTRTMAIGGMLICPLGTSNTIQYYFSSTGPSNGLTILQLGLII